MTINMEAITINYGVKNKKEFIPKFMQSNRTKIRDYLTYVKPILQDKGLYSLEGVQNSLTKERVLKIIEVRSSQENYSFRAFSVISGAGAIGAAGIGLWPATIILGLIALLFAAIQYFTSKRNAKELERLTAELAVKSNS